MQSYVADAGAKASTRGVHTYSTDFDMIWRSVQDSPKYSVLTLMERLRICRRLAPAKMESDVDIIPPPCVPPLRRASRAFT